MQKFFLLIAIAFCFSGCTNQGTSETEKKDSPASTTPPVESKAEKNKQSALASTKAFSDHDLNTSMQYCDPSFTDYGDGSGPPVKGLDSAKAFLQSFLNAFPDMKADNLIAFSNDDGSEVVLTGEWTGTFKNDFMGMKATGKSFKMNEADIFTFNDEGKITSHRNIQPFATILNQVAAKMPKK